MDFLSTKALTIAVGIAVSLTITSSILFTLNQITKIYQGVYNTDISIRKQFTEFAMYDGTLMTGLEMINTAKKYKDNQSVNVIYSGNTINTTSWINIYKLDPNRTEYTDKLYDVTYFTDTRGIIMIYFKTHVI